MAVEMSVAQMLKPHLSYAKVSVAVAAQGLTAEDWEVSKSGRLCLRQAGLLSSTIG